MDRTHLTQLYEQELAELHSLNDRVIATTREWAHNADLGPSLASMMEELRLRSHLVAAARSMAASEDAPALAAVA